jgi:hypothetical protein
MSGSYSTSAQPRVEQPKEYTMQNNYATLAKASDEAVDAAHTMLEQAIHIFVNARNAMEAPCQTEAASQAAWEVADEMLLNVVASYNAKIAALAVWGPLHCEPANQDNARDAACNNNMKE